MGSMRTIVKMGIEVDGGGNFGGDWTLSAIKKKTAAQKPGTAYMRRLTKNMIITEYQAYIRARRLVGLYRRAYWDSDRYRK